MENTKKEYQAPQLTVVTMKAERGYAGSVLSSLFFWENSWGSEQIEDYNNRSGWTDDGSNTFWGS